MAIRIGSTDGEMQVLRSIVSKVYQALTTTYFGLSVFSIGVTFLMMLLVSTDVFCRYLFNKPISGTLELVEFAVIVIFFPGLAFIQFKHWHIRVDLIYDRFTPRIKSFVEVVTLCIGLIIFGIAVWQNILAAIQYYEVKAASEILRIPPYLFRIVIAIGFFFFSLEMLIQLVQQFHPSQKLRKGRSDV